MPFSEDHQALLLQPVPSVHAPFVYSFVHLSPFSIKSYQSSKASLYFTLLMRHVLATTAHYNLCFLGLPRPYYDPYDFPGTSSHTLWSFLYGGSNSEQLKHRHWSRRSLGSNPTLPYWPYDPGQLLTSLALRQHINKKKGRMAYLAE